ncbi:MAG: hypothetical protein MUD08_15515 [Cytophagales bacterium]|nr:hypothetical protein [Cytophagales bacterium]
MKKAIRVFLVVLLAVAVVQAQSAKRLFKEADGYFEEKLYTQALDLYLQGLKSDPENPKANFQAGICYLETAYKEKSLPYLKKALQLKPDIHAQLLVFLGEAYQYNHQFPEAIKQYEAFLKNVDKNEPVTAHVNRKIYECHNGIRYLKDPVKAKIDNIGSVINSKYADFAPVISANEAVLVFTSRREGSTGGEMAPEDNQFFEDMYITYKGNGTWTVPRNLKEINTDQHDACVALSPDGKQLFIYRDKNGGDLYSSNFDAVKRRRLVLVEFRRGEQRVGQAAEPRRQREHEALRTFDFHDCRRQHDIFFQQPARRRGRAGHLPQHQNTRRQVG